MRLMGITEVVRITKYAGMDVMFTSFLHGHIQVTVQLAIGILEMGSEQRSAQ